MASPATALDGKRVVVIGGATGIGFATAELAHELGASIVIGSSNAAKVAMAAERLHGAAGYPVDLRDEASVASFFGTIGPFDHLAITAGDWSPSMFGATRHLDLAQARDLLAIRFWGVLAAAKHDCEMIAQDGSMTLTSGMLTHRPRKGTAIATAIGGAVEHLTLGLAMDLAPVRVNAVCPGLVLTEQVRKMPREMLQSMVESLPVPRGAEPSETAKAYVYLMSNGYATGQVLSVDGGGMMV